MNQNRKADARRPSLLVWAAGFTILALTVAIAYFVITLKAHTATTYEIAAQTLLNSAADQQASAFTSLLQQTQRDLLTLTSNAQNDPIALSTYLAANSTRAQHICLIDSNGAEALCYKISASQTTPTLSDDLATVTTRPDIISALAPDALARLTIPRDYIDTNTTPATLHRTFP